MKKMMVFVLVLLFVVGCQAETVTETIEVTRLVTQTESIEVEGQTVEVTRVVTEVSEETVEVVVEVGEVELAEQVLAEQVPAENVTENGFVAVAEDGLSTFAIDVDTGSYTLMRQAREAGTLPAPETVRTEEFVNYFEQNYPRPETGAFSINIEAAPSPFTSEAGDYLVRVGIQGYEVADDARPDANLIFVIDTSGSMDAANRLGLVKWSLEQLVENLRPSDTVGIVTYGDRAEIALAPTPVSQSFDIINAIRELRTGGSTNAEAGLLMAYDLAAQIGEPGEINRLILCSDGLANVGNTAAEAILQHAEEGISLSTFGFGTGGYNDALMEQLANQGDGVYGYIDTEDEAQRLFIDDLTGTLLTIAKDAKIQVEFNAAVVAQYRLLGYENREVADSQFRDDSVDAGEIGAGHSVTALYEVRPVADAPLAQAAFTVRVRYADPDTTEVREIAQSMALRDFATDFADASPHFQFMAMVAEYAEVLRGSMWVDGTTLESLVPEILRVAGPLADDSDIQEFIGLIIE